MAEEKCEKKSEEKTERKTAREIIENYDGPKVRIMEVCGTHTHEIFRLGIRRLLPEQVELISGPGCPVCVTPVSFIDEAIYLALEKGVTICTFGDLVRVPGTKMSLAVISGPPLEQKSINVCLAFLRSFRLTGTLLPLSRRKPVPSKSTACSRLITTPRLH